MLLLKYSSPILCSHTLTALLLRSECATWLGQLKSFVELSILSQL